MRIKFYSGNLNQINSGLVLDGSLLLKRILNKYDVEVWAGLRELMA